MLQSKKIVKLSNLINDCVVMIQQAGHLVQQTHLQNLYTSEGAHRRESIAQVDLLIRQTYLHNLSQLFPGIQLICQGESPTSQVHYADDAYIQPDELLEARSNQVLTPSLLQQKAQLRTRETQQYKDQLAQVLQSDDCAASMNLIAGAYTEELQMQDIAVWIDPIDGSKALADGDINHVTNMIGITIKGRPIVGIIHKPFTSQQKNSSRTYVGSIESGLFFLDHSLSDRSTSSATYVSPFEEQTQSAGNGGHFQPHMCFGTDSEQQNMMEGVFQDLMPLKVNRVKGPGNKFLHLANERSDFFLNLVPGYSMWDLCASEAIFAARGGVLTDARQKPLFYDSTRRSFGLFNGVVAARDASTYLRAKDVYESRSGRTLAASQTQIRRDLHLKNQQINRTAQNQL